MLKLFHFLVFIYEFSQETHAFVKKSGDATEPEDPETAAFLRNCYRRIINITTAVVVVGNLAIPVQVPWIGWLFFSRRSSVSDVIVVILGGVLASLPIAILYVFAGVATGCLFAPTAFMQSPAGAMWMTLIGTKNPVGAKMICVVVMLLGIAVMLAVATIQIIMVSE